jgi:hypothetical protein
MGAYDKKKRVHTGPTIPNVRQAGVPLSLNMIWVITIKCTGPNSHGSCCSCANSQGTLSQRHHHIGLFRLIFLFHASSPPPPPPHPPMVVKTTANSIQALGFTALHLPHGSKLKLKKSPMDTMEGCPGY